MRRIPVILILLAVGAWLILPRVGETCGPFFDQAMFVRPYGPDRPMGSFADGRIGIVLPKWYRVYLVIAYRYFESKPLSGSEKRALLERWDVDCPTGPPDRTEQAISFWTCTRARYRPGEAAGRIREFREIPGKFYDVPNCLASAFTTAAATLQDRAQRFGAGSPELKEWIRGQDAVFSNCIRGSKIPPELPPTTSAWLRADRAYQIAAAHFYSGQYEDAANRFRAIAKDTTSPWHTIAAYLVARALVRQASTPTPEGQTYNPAVLAAAETWLKQILNDPEQKPVREDAEALLEMVRYHLYPVVRQRELGRLLAKAGNGDRFGQRLVDYTWLLDRSLDIEPEFPGVDEYGKEYERRRRDWMIHRYMELKAERADDLSDWVMTIQSMAPAARNHALAKWTNTQAVPWLVAAMLKVNSSDAMAKDLMTAAGAIPTDSPAYPTVTFHRARLANQAGNHQLAREVLKEAIPLSGVLPPSALHLLQDEQMMAAKNFEDFQAQLWQTPLLVSGEADQEEPVVGCYSAECGLTFYGIATPPKSAQLLPQFSPAAATLLNTRLPLEVFVRVAQSSSLPENLRSRMAPAAWARAALLNEAELARNAADVAIAAQPELRKYIEAYAGAKTPEERQFAAAFAVLQFPGLRPFVDDSFPRTTPFARIDSYRDNWWCEDVGGVAAKNNYLKNDFVSEETAEPSGATLSPAFLTCDQQSRAAEDWNQLRSIGSAARYLPRIVVDWAGQHRDDPRVPEALHLAVRATRYGCEDEKPNKLSRKAFMMLHQNYPRSEWTKKTPFWFH